MFFMGKSREMLFLPLSSLPIRPHNPGPNCQFRSLLKQNAIRHPGDQTHWQQTIFYRFPWLQHSCMAWSVLYSFNSLEIISPISRFSFPLVISIVLSQFAWARVISPGTKAVFKSWFTNNAEVITPKSLTRIGVCETTAGERTNPFLSNIYKKSSWKTSWNFWLFRSSWDNTHRQPHKMFQFYRHAK